MEYKYNEKQLRIQQQFYNDRGKWKWNDTWATILALNPDVMSAYSTMSSIAHKKNRLSPKQKELIYISIDNAITHYYTPGFMSHLRHGMNDVGCTKEELAEAFVISSTIGTATYSVCAPILREVLEQRGLADKNSLSDEQKSIRTRWENENGYWNDTLDTVLRYDPEMLESYMDYVKASDGGALDAVTRELLYIAVNASPTALNTDATRLHINRALDAGASIGQIMEVFELIACLGVHSVTVGIPAVNTVLEEKEDNK